MKKIFQFSLFIFLTVVHPVITTNLRILSGGESTPTTNYNCTSNCLKCETKPPNKCHQCLFRYFVDEKTHDCKECKVDRCNLCAEADKCKTCRVGHKPEGNKCIPAPWFRILAFILFFASFSMGIVFFFAFCYCVVFVKSKEDHHHHHDNKHQLNEGLKNHEKENEGH